MNIVWILLLLMMSLSSLSASETLKQERSLTPSEIMENMEHIKKYAVVLGEGEKEIHTFIDPNGSLSQRYLQIIFKQKKVMFKKYRIYLYLLALPRQGSDGLIKTILSADDSLAALKSVMIDKERLVKKESRDAQRAVSEISDTASRIGVYKRPYIIINGKVR